MAIAVPRDSDAVLEGVRPVWTEGVHELRILNTARGTVSGYFENPEKLAAAAMTWSGKAPGVYATINPVVPALLARASNHLKERSRTTTSDSDIAARHWIPVDFDPRRPADISSTDEQHTAALHRARDCGRWLVDLGIDRTSLILADSGNGGHLLIRVDLPNDDRSSALIRRCLEAIATRFSDEVIDIDLTSSNPSRIWKVYGTLTCKGDNLPQYPHRVARVLQAPERVAPTNSGLLDRLAALAPPEPIRSASRGSFSVRGFVEKHLAHDVAFERDWQGGHRWVLSVCPFNPDHTDRSAVVIEMASGAGVFVCHHNGCIGRDWRDLRELLEPKAARPTPISTELKPESNGHTPVPVESNGHGPAPRRFPLTDMGNGERMAAQHGPNLRYVSQLKHWHYWDGQRWSLDVTQEIHRRAATTIRRIRSEADDLDDDKARAEVLSWAQRSENRQRKEALLNEAGTQVPISARQELFDQDPRLLNCLNGTLDLNRGELRDHKREDYITKMAAAPFLPEARSELWENCLKRWTSNNEELMSFLQRAAGYSLTGLTGEEVMFFLYGHGRNGKTKFLNAMTYALGDYAKRLRAEALMVRQGGSDIPNEIAQLVGARFVHTVEIEEGARLAESLVKQLTGGDKISARFMRAEFFEFRPEMKIWMAANHKPNVRGTDIAIWQRILTIPFTETIPIEERDQYLEEKLEREAPAILAWMVRGCIEWHRIGLHPPEIVKLATDEYRGEMDILGNFIEDRCVASAGKVVATGKIYEAYAAWCKDSGERQWSQQLFGRKLAERGFEKVRVQQARYWEGLDINEA